MKKVTYLTMEEIRNQKLELRELPFLERSLFNTGESVQNDGKIASPQPTHPPCAALSFRGNLPAMLREVFLILLFAFLALPGCIGVSGDVTPQGQDQSRVVLAIPLDRPYSYRQQDGDKRLTAQGFLRGQVVSVYDGNTLTVLIEGRTEKIRLIGVDVPELAHAPWGEQARESLKTLVEGKTVRLETDITLRDQDKRLLAYVYTAELLVNAEMIRQGQACLHIVPPNVAHMEDYRKAQTEAREIRRAACYPPYQ